MMVMAGGQERTSAQFAELLGKAGFGLEEVVPTASALSLLVAKPLRKATEGREVGCSEQ